MIDLNGFKRSVQAGENEATGWLVKNIPFLDQNILLGFCGCLGCSRHSFQIFSDASTKYGQDTIKGAIRQGLSNVDDLHPAALDVARLYPSWIKGQIDGGNTRGYFLKEGRVEKIVGQLSELSSQKLASDPIARRYSRHTNNTLSVLENYFDLPLETINIYRDFAINETIQWINKRNDYYLRHERNKKPTINKNLPFEIRWEMFTERDDYNFIYRYFDLKNDRKILEGKIHTSQNRNEIIKSMPTKRVSWKRFSRFLA